MVEGVNDFMEAVMCQLIFKFRFVIEFLFSEFYGRFIPSTQFSDLNLDVLKKIKTANYYEETNKKIGKILKYNSCNL